MRIKKILIYFIVLSVFYGSFNINKMVAAAQGPINISSDKEEFTWTFAVADGTPNKDQYKVIGNDLIKDNKYYYEFLGKINSGGEVKLANLFENQDICRVSGNEEKLYSGEFTYNDTDGTKYLAFYNFGASTNATFKNIKLYDINDCIKVTLNNDEHSQLTSVDFADTSNGYSYAYGGAAAALSITVDDGYIIDELTINGNKYDNPVAGINSVEIPNEDTVISVKTKVDPEIHDVYVNLLPVVGNAPTTASDNEKYTGNISWTDSDENSVTIFEKDKDYIASVVLTPKSGYSFAEDCKFDFGCNDYTIQKINEKITARVGFNTHSLNPAEIQGVQDGQTDVSPRLENVTVKFNQLLDSNSVGAVQISPYVENNVTILNDSCVISFKKELAFNTDYKIIFNTGFYAANGIALENDYEISFATGELPLSMVSSDPLSGGVDFMPEDNILITFDYPINEETLENSVSITPAVSISSSLSQDKKTITIDPLEKLQYNTKYIISVKSSLMSEYNVSAQPFNIEFTTLALCTNKIRNGNLENTSDISMFTNSPHSATTYAYDVFENENVIKVLMPGDAAGGLGYNFSWTPGHTYYMSALIYSEVEQNVSLGRVYYKPNGDFGFEGELGKTNVPAKKWTTISYVGTFPDVSKALDVRINFSKGGSKAYVKKWELYDTTTAEKGQPNIATNPENGTLELSPYDLKLTLSFDKQMMPNTVNTSNITVNNGATVKNIVIADDLTEAIVYLDNTEINKTYTISMSEGIKSLYGTPIQPKNTTLSTYSVDEQPITLVSSSPYNNESNVKFKNLTLEAVLSTHPKDSTLLKENFVTSPAGIIESISTDENDHKKLLIKFDDKSIESGKTYSVTFTDSILSMTGKSFVPVNVTFSTKTDDYLVNTYNSSKSNLAAMKAFIENEYIDMGNPYDLILYLGKNSIAYDAAVTKIISRGSAANVDDIKAQIEDEILSASVEYAVTDDDADYILNSEMLGLAALKTYDTYKSLENKNSVRSSLLGAKDLTTAKLVRDFVNLTILQNAFVNANGWEQVKNIYENNEFLWQEYNISSLLSLINKSTSYQLIYNKCQNLKADSLKAMYDALNSSYKDIVSSSSTGGGNGGGGGGSGSGSKNPTVTNGILPRDNTASIVYEDKKELFDDLTNVPWAKSSIEKLYNKGIINGIGNGSFAPNSFVKREEFIKMFIDLKEINTDISKTSFGDVDESAWYSPYINKAVSLGIASGIDENTFGIGANITRQDAAALIFRYIKYIGRDNITDNNTLFNDSDKISEYAMHAVSSLHSSKIISGDENGYFKPQNNMTRAEAAVMICNLLDVIEEDNNEK